MFTAIDVETQLIRHYSASTPVPWNNSGFGSNDPGRNRDTTDLKPEGFDARYPIDLDHVVELDVAPGASAATVLAALRKALHEGGRKTHADLETTIVPHPPSSPMTMRGVMTSVLNVLPAGWQATALAGRVILYKETRDYPFGAVIARSENQKA